MKAIEILSTKNVKLASPDTTATVERDAVVYLIPDSEVELKADNSTHVYDPGMFLYVSVRHNGSAADKIAAFKDIIALINSIILEEGNDYKKES